MSIRHRLVEKGLGCSFIIENHSPVKGSLSTISRVGGSESPISLKAPLACKQQPRPDSDKTAVLPRIDLRVDSIKKAVSGEEVTRKVRWLSIA